MMNWLMNLEVQIWNLNLVKAINTHIQETKFLYSLLNTEGKKKFTSVLFTQKFNTPEDWESQTAAQRRQELTLHSCQRQDEESISNVSVAVFLQAATPYTRANLQKNPFSQSIMWRQALGHRRQNRLEKQGFPWFGVVK